MSASASTKPYMLRAIYEWCVDNGFTPYLAVAVDINTRVPMGYVKDGEIVLNINHSATRDLLIGNEAISFSARFNGVSTAIYVPVDAVRGLFARESGEGLFFDPVVPDAAVASVTAPAPAGPKKPTLHVVK